MISENNKPMEIICVACPKGCRLEVMRDGEEILVTKQGCKRGVDYAISEVCDPRRMLATTIRIEHAIHPLLPVYTERPVPVGKIKELLALLRTMKLDSPVKEGQVVLEDVLGTGINVLASRDM